MVTNTSNNEEQQVVQISSVKFLIGCLMTALVMLWMGTMVRFSPLFLAVEVLITIMALFIFGSTRYQLDKNALTYGASMVILATFTSMVWPESNLQSAWTQEGPVVLWDFAKEHLLGFHALDELIHADTMLFILGLTFFVAVVAQTRILESVSFYVLQRNQGKVLPTIVFLTALVAISSGVLDGVSMIGLMIRTLVIILFLAKIRDEAVVYAVMVSTIITTVCGMWLAYGEPPNLIMKANLHPHLTNGFFLRYCLPVAFGSYLLVYWNLRKKIGTKKIDMGSIDVMDEHTADLRFLQAQKHGEVETPIEFVEKNADLIDGHVDQVVHRLHSGEPLGEALINEKVPAEKRRKLLGAFVTDSLAEALDDHYHAMAEGRHETGRSQSMQKISAALEHVKKQRVKAQWIGGVAFLPFVGMLIWHAVDHSVPLYLASFVGFVLAFLSIVSYPKIRSLAIREGMHEYKEYLFLFPLFLSITLLQKSGFFDQISHLLHMGIEKFGLSVMALIQFFGATIMSAMLDNNVVADFAGRALLGLEIGTMHLFAMAQIAGYALGGCWTHIGSAQSVVAFSFIKREVNSHYSPFQWIKAMTPLIIEIFVLVVVIVFVEGSMVAWLK